MENRSISMLIVDDHPVIRDGIRTMLENTSLEGTTFNLAEAGNSYETFEALEHQSFDLVILDYQLSDTNGGDLTREILSRYPSLRILALSNYDELSYAQHMLQAGGHGYVLKNVGVKELVEAIKAVVNGRLYFATHLANGIIANRFSEQLNNKTLDQDPNIAKLSKREIEIIQLISDQMTNEEIAQKLFLSKRTIDNHRQNILNKLGMNNTAGLVRFAVENGLV